VDLQQKNLSNIKFLYSHRRYLKIADEKAVRTGIFFLALIFNNLPEVF